VATLDAIWADVRLVVRRALAAGDAETAITVVTHLAIEGMWRRPEVFSWASDAVDRFGSRPGPHRHELLGVACMGAGVRLDFDLAIALGREAMACDPAPGTSLDCLPESALGGVYGFLGRVDDAEAVLRPAFVALDGSPDTWNTAILHAMLALELIIAGQDTGVREEVARALAAANASRNPTALAHAWFARGCATMGTEPEAAVNHLQTSLSIATSVRNGWIGAIGAATLAGAQSELHPADAFDAYIVAADRLRRMGLLTHAWGIINQAAELAVTLGRRDEAALLIGACEASGALGLMSAQGPFNLDDLFADQDAAHLASLCERGRALSLSDVLDVLRRAEFDEVNAPNG
jgi:hypothetical protein